jgi:hypothetical protein
MQHVPGVDCIDLCSTKGVENAKEMRHRGLPDADQELVQEIHSEHLVVVEAKRSELRESVLRQS